MKGHRNPPTKAESFPALVRRMERVLQRAKAQASRAREMKKAARDMHDGALAMRTELYRPILP